MSKTKKGAMYYLKRDWQLYALLLIPFIFVITFKILPLGGLVIAFKDYKIARGFWGSEWVGLDVFRTIFKHRDFLPALRNTLLLNVLDLVIGFPMPIILAILLNEVRNKWFKRTSQTILYLPHFISWVVIGALAYQIFGFGSGLVNNVLENIGADRVPFLQENMPWLISYVMIGVWQTMGWGTIIYLASISGINPELYEAATVDGANRFRQIVNITIPSIKSTIITLLIMNLGKIMGGSFERIIAMENKAVTQFSTTIPVLVYRWGIGGGNFSRATALGLFQSVIGLLLVLLSDYFAKKIGEDGLL